MEVPEGGDVCIHIAIHTVEQRNLAVQHWTAVLLQVTHTLLFASFYRLVRAIVIFMYVKICVSGRVAMVLYCKSSHVSVSWKSYQTLPQ